MDKIAANNHFVTMNKEIKKAKAMVAGNLIRKINKLKSEKEKFHEDKARIEKIDKKVENILADTKRLKHLDSQEIAKLATLKPEIKLWNKIVEDSKVNAENRLIARVITKNNVQKQVSKFRNDHKDCDEWINEYIEYKEKKRQLTKHK